MVRLSTQHLSQHGSASARLDAELLAATALGIRRLDLYLQFDRPLDEPELAAIRELVRRRVHGEPIAYITGVREFHSRTFVVTPAVLIPRPETELLVEAALQQGRARGAGALRIADLGTGSGCLAVTLACELAQAQVWATDISAAALEVARGNAARHGVVERVTCAQGRWAEPLRDAGPFDLVVSNPPYISAAEMGELAADVRDHEPAAALEAGAEGLDAYMELLPSVAGLMAPAGWIGLEIDPRRRAAVVGLAERAFPGASISVEEDLAGRDRVVAISLKRAEVG